MHLEEIALNRVLRIALIQQTGLVIADIADAFVHWPASHFVRRKGAQQIDWQPCWISGLHPTFVVLRFQNHRHSIMYLLGDFIGISRENREGLQRLAFFWLPPF